jgi:hypothetical protein
MRDLADPPRREERNRDRPSRRGKGRRLDQADEPAIPAADPRDDRASDGGLPLQAVLSGFQHPHGALEFEIARVGHVNLDQEMRHGAMVDRVVAS